LSLNTQVLIYSVDTSFFYNEAEMKIHNAMSPLYLDRHELNKFKHRYKEKLNKEKNELKKNEIDEQIKDVVPQVSDINKKISKHKKDLKAAFPHHEGIRYLDNNRLTNKNKISVFETSLTRTLGIQVNQSSNDMIVVQVYYLEILDDLILNGFMWNDEKYICFTASAGQIRNKKTVFLREDLYELYKKSLMCGLTVEKINEKGGINVNKFLAYTALCNTASDEWNDFDITKAIVVPDMETNVRSNVDFIDDKTYEIVPQEMDIPIEHTDGAGMILTKKSKKSFMCRLPWIKGLLVPTPFDKFIREANKRNPKRKYGLVTDIYGQDYDLLKEDIEVIFTKSQFKMHKYYDNWKEYQNNFRVFNSKAGKTNIEENKFNNAKINYQMLQTLHDMTDSELKEISKITKNDIINIGSDRNTMLKVLGVVDSNLNKNYMQQALDVYPELLNDKYNKEILKQVKKSLVKQARYGKLDINGVFTFICPDMYAFCEYLILGDKNPKGLLKNGEVFCKIYDEHNKLDCLRSPHLFKEHAVRNNVIDKEKKRWFVTDGLYTSVHDPISKLLMFDVDGDKSLVCADDTIIKVAERNMKGVNPLYYNMRKAKPEIIDNESIRDGLKTAYKGGNIGEISNNITKIWNSKDVDIDVVKLLCMENNFTIDFAKTLYKPKRPKDKSKEITKFTKLKTPHFFIYSKDKEESKVEEVSDSVVDRLEDMIPNPIINFRRAKLGKFDYKMLMDNQYIELNEDVISIYDDLDKRKHFMISKSDNDYENLHNTYYYIKMRFLETGYNEKYITDVLIEYLYIHKNSSYKTTLWECFGDVLVENLNKNIEEKYGKNSSTCEICGNRVRKTNNRKKYCNDCWIERQRELWRENKRKQRNSV